MKAMLFNDLFRNLTAGFMLGMGGVWLMQVA